MTLRRGIYPTLPANRLLLAMALAIALLPLARLRAQSDPGLNATCPIQFFTNLASRLVAADLHLSLDHLAVHPASQYTPALHRLLQVTANLYDTTTTNDWPTVFRPVFRTDGTNVFIVGYHELTDAQLLRPGLGTMLDPSDTNQLQQIPRLGTPDQGPLAEPLLVGVPLVIGAKKGLPNFNEFALQTVAQVARKLQFTKDPAGVLILTNQMYFLTLSNLFGVEVWNAYTTTYSRGLQMSVAVDLTTVLSNQIGALYSQRTIYAASYPPLIATGWPAPVPVDAIFHRYLASAPAGTGFFIPLRTNVLFLPNSQYRGTNTPSLFPENAAWPVGPTGFAVPDLKLLLTARVRFALVDTNLDRIIDYVNLANLTQAIDLTTALIATSSQDVMASLWLTNRPTGSLSESVPTMGIINQIRVSLGLTTTTLSDWNSFSVQALSGQDKAKAVDAFREFMGLSAIVYPNQPSYGPTMQAPFNPVRKLSVETTWQVNDPSVHYTSGDLGKTNLSKVVSPPISTNYSILANLGYMNSRTRPWGGNPSDVLVAYGVLQPREDPNAYDLTIKDPQVRIADDWDFPTNAPLNLRWLGRVHRGTPWQTIYLKSAPVTPSLWQSWTGNPDALDAQLTQPTGDWRLASLLVSLLNTNDPWHLLSVNASAPAAWLAALNGLSVLTNTVTDAAFRDPRLLGQFASLLGDSNSPPAAVLADAISQARFQQPGQFFRTVGDLLATPALTLASPWLNVTDVQQQRGLSDEAYEIIPEQLLPLLRPDSIGALALSDGAVQLQFTGFDTATYVLEHSPDLVNWMAVGTNTPANGVVQFTLPAGPGAPAGFFRSVLLP